MNVMFKINGTVVTPALTGSILRGVTRKSAIELLKSWGVPVEERLLSVDELFDAAASGALEEAWCIGTAAVISPIGELSWGDRDYKVNDNKIGALSQKLYDELTGISGAQSPTRSAGSARSTNFAILSSLSYREKAVRLHRLFPILSFCYRFNSCKL